MNDRSVQINLTWHPRYLYQEFHASDLWLDEQAIASTKERQGQKKYAYPTALDARLGGFN